MLYTGREHTTLFIKNNIIKFKLKITDIFLKK